MQGWTLFFSVFGVIFVAELHDKTALAALVLATRHRPLPVVVGAGTALTIQSVVAIWAGHLVSLLPARPGHSFAGGMFLVSAVLMWPRKEGRREAREGDEQAGFRRPTWLAFAVVLVAEWGDLTQLSTVALPLGITRLTSCLRGSAVALWGVPGIVAVVGNRGGTMLDRRLTKRIAAVLFAAVGTKLIGGVL